MVKTLWILLSSNLKLQILFSKKQRIIFIFFVHCFEFPTFLIILPHYSCLSLSLMLLLGVDAQMHEIKGKKREGGKRRRTKYYDTFWLKPTAGYNFISYSKFFSTVRILNVLDSNMYFWAHNSSIHRSIYKEFLPMWLTKHYLIYKNCKRYLYLVITVFSSHEFMKRTYKKLY